MIEEISIPDSVRELGDKCFFWCEKLRRVSFGACSTLELIGVMAFSRTMIEEISIPDSVRELGDECFLKCKKLHRVMFGACSRLERIGVRCFRKTDL